MPSGSGRHPAVQPNRCRVMTFDGGSLAGSGQSGWNSGGTAFSSPATHGERRYTWPMNAFESA